LSVIDGKNALAGREIPAASQLQWRFSPAAAPAEITPHERYWPHQPGELWRTELFDY